MQDKIDEILNMNYWPEKLETIKSYVSTHDDNDGNECQTLNLVITPDGDVHIQIPNGKMLRFRTFCGGGKYPKIRNALLVLAEAVRQEAAGE